MRRSPAPALFSDGGALFCKSNKNTPPTANRRMLWECGSFGGRTYRRAAALFWDDSKDGKWKFGSPSGEFMHVPLFGNIGQAI